MVDFLWIGFSLQVVGKGENKKTPNYCWGMKMVGLNFLERLCLNAF